MAKRTVHLTESQFQKLVEDVVNELTINQAAIGKVYNTLARQDIRNGEDTVTFGSQNKDSRERLGKSEEIQYPLLSKTITDNLGRFPLVFIQDSGIGNSMPITFYFSDVLYLNANRLILLGQAFLNNEESRGAQGTPIKMYYDSQNHLWYWISSFRIDMRHNVRVYGRRTLDFPIGERGWLQQNVQNRNALFGIINTYIDTVNQSLPDELKLQYHIE